MNIGAIIAATVLVAAVGLFIGVFLGDKKHAKMPATNCDRQFFAS